MNAFKLEEVGTKSEKFKTPKSCCLPYGSLERALGKEEREDLNKLFKQLNDANDIITVDKLHLQLAKEFSELLETETANKVIEEYVHEIKEFLSSASALIAVRSSSNIEDLKKLSGAGLFDSILNVIASDEKGIADAIRNVWKSLYSKRAIQSRFKYRINQEYAAMGILVQEMILSDYSFIIHTSNPVIIQITHR